MSDTSSELSVDTAVGSETMSVHTGVDVVSIERIQAVCEQESTNFRDRVFTAQERDYCEATQHPAEHYAARWCIKEAVQKVVVDPGPVRFRDIETVRTSGRPELRVSASAATALTETFGATPDADHVDTSISLSHDRTSDTAIGTVTIAVCERS